MDDRTKLANDAYLDDGGVYRWKCNDRVPFDDFLTSAGVSAEVRRRCTEARSVDSERFIEAYRKMRESTPYSHEELFEMRAAFGNGAEVVNVITGKKTRL